VSDRIYGGQTSTHSTVSESPINPKTLIYFTSIAHANTYPRKCQTIKVMLQQLTRGNICEIILGYTQKTYITAKVRN